MVLIVEMWWGKAHEIVVEDVDEQGELYVREVIPNGPPDPERRTFSCHASNWTTAQALAKAFGWVPQGAVVRPWRGTEGLVTVRDTDYVPDGWIRGVHRVDADDATAWGRALEACVQAIDAGMFDLPDVQSPVLIRDGMTLDQFRQANRGLTVQFLRSFAAFLSKGAFEFGWDS